MPDDITLSTLTGPAILHHLPALADLRIKIFRDFPYLYDGTPDYEQTYLKTYATAPGAAVILARHENTVIGASTCLPLAQETPNIQNPFIEAGWDVAKIFYFGESVLDPAYRNRGIGVAFFAAREAHAKSHAASIATFCAVNRPENHPLRPATYQPLDHFWRNRGYEKQPLTCQMTWRDLGEPADTAKTLTFWSKPL
jgi:GNAT superfamily N-acetyltransferase